MKTKPGKTGKRVTQNTSKNKNSKELVDLSFVRRNFGVRLKDYIITKGLTIEELAKLSNCSEKVILEIFAGNIPNSKFVEILAILFNEYGLNYNWIITGETKWNIQHHDLMGVETINLFVNNKLQSLVGKVKEEISHFADENPELIGRVLAAVDQINIKK